MASLLLRLAPAATATIFSLLALIFSVLAATSKKWAVRDNYDPVLNPPDWKEPIYTLYRSPFIVCTATLANASAAGQSPVTATDFEVHCTQFRPFGFNRTSCELAIATQDDISSTLGDARLCQQIHYAGNYWLTSATFIGLAFLLTLILAVVTLLKRPEFASETQNAEIETTPLSAQQSSDTEQPAAPVQPQQGSVWVKWAVLGLLTFSFVGFATALIGQYYGVLGLIQSLPNNSDFASSAAASQDDVNTQGSHGPWYQGIALSVYATLSWGFSIAAGVIASRAWPLPQWKVAL